MDYIDQRYKDKVDILNIVPIGDFDATNLISSDNYDEDLLLKKLGKMGPDACLLLQKCAVHISIIGSGNKSFGAIRHNGKVCPLQEVFDQYNVSYKNIQNASLQPDDLTPRRLVRLYRFHISAFIERTKRPSYLWLKYSDRSKEMMNICFPGAEHMVKNVDEYQYLVNTYDNLDHILNTKFVARMHRIGIARGLLSPKY
jgi:hypothetical protein